MILETAVEKYLAEVAADPDKSPLTVTTYQSNLRALLAYIGSGLECQALTWQDIHNFVGYVKGNKYQPATNALYAVVTRNLLHFMIREEYIDWSTAHTLKAEVALKNLGKHSGLRFPAIPDLEDLEKVMQATYESPLPSPIKERNIALVEMLASTGCRVSELARLRIGDLNLKKREFVVRQGKGRKDRKVFFSPTAVNACLQYWRARKDAAPTSPVFARHDDGAGKVLRSLSTRSMENIITSLAKIAGVKDFTPHKFRHLFATRLLEETSDLSMVQEALGHSSPETTRIYARVNAENVRRAHQEIWK